MQFAYAIVGREVDDLEGDGRTKSGFGGGINSNTGLGMRNAIQSRPAIDLCGLSHSGSLLG